MKDVIERVPPHNLEAEQAVLAAMMVDREAIARVSQLLAPESFYRQAHGLIFEAVRALYERGEPVDLITLRDELGTHLDEVGGYGYLVDLAASIPTTAHAEYYGKIVADKALLRHLIRVGTEIVAGAFAEEEDVETILDSAERAILEVGQRRQTGSMTPIKDVINETFEAIETRYHEKSSLLGSPTGFYDLDGMLNGFQPSDLLILAARPAMGKTSLALNFCRNVAVETNKPVLIYSLEMGKEQLVQRMLCAEAGIDSHRLRTGFLAEPDWAKLVQAIGLLSETPIYIHDAGALTVAELRSTARRVMAEAGELGLIMVDYLQLMSSGTSSTKDDNRAAAMGAISRGLKQLARELRVPVVALSQLSRAVESRPNKRPMLSDLRESGSIEQDADIVMFIYRDEYYNPDTDKKSTAEVIVAKHRNGPVGHVELFFEKTLTKFQSITTQSFSGGG
ncbi:MAG: replicative DNA helicase [Candidatus Sericytochromatia bacterium]|nr:replicative DNA helicase [Candidatus Sericytochromatia bacterium]